VCIYHFRLELDGFLVLPPRVEYPALLLVSPAKLVVRLGKLGIYLQRVPEFDDSIIRFPLGQILLAARKMLLFLHLGILATSEERQTQAAKERKCQDVALAEQAKPSRLPDGREVRKFCVV
jgi:hypothetical protein